MRTAIAFLIGCVVGATGALMVRGGPVSGGAPVPALSAVEGSSPAPSRGHQSAGEDTGAPLSTGAPLDIDAPLLIPVRGVVATDLKSHFNERRGGRTHEAIDILAPRGTPVLAVADGTIKKLFTSNAGGLTIYQYDVTDSICFYYAHLAGYANIREGQRLRRGDVIGYVGTSGNAPLDTPHLHFAINKLTPTKEWWKGTPIDPYPLLTKPASALP